MFLYTLGLVHFHICYWTMPLQQIGGAMCQGKPQSMHMIAPNHCGDDGGLQGASLDGRMKPFGLSEVR